MKEKLSVIQHRRLGASLKHVRRILLDDAALISKFYPTVARTLNDLAGELIVPRSFLEGRMMEETGDRDLARSTYFGELAPAKEKVE
jgi:hypothetical protein